MMNTGNSTTTMPSNMNASGMNVVVPHPPSQMSSQSIPAGATGAVVAAASVAPSIVGSAQHVPSVHHQQPQQPQQPLLLHRHQPPQQLSQQSVQPLAHQHQQHMAQAHGSRGMMNVVAGNNNGLFENFMRVPSQLIGRLIGKNGASVRRLMDETGTSITVSDNPSGQESYSPYDQAERMVIIRGNSMEAVNYAQTKVVNKLRSFHEADMNAGVMYPPTAQMNSLNLGPGGTAQPLMMAGGGGTGGMPSGQHVYAGGAFPSSGNGYGMHAAPGGTPSNLATLPQLAQPMYSTIYYPPQAMAYPSAAFPQYFHPQAIYQQHQSTGRQVEVKCRLHVPNSVVGALIGTRGCHIRELVRITRANIRIDSLPEHSRARENSSRGGASGSGGTAQQWSPDQHANGEKKEFTSEEGGEDTDGMDKFRRETECHSASGTSQMPTECENNVEKTTSSSSSIDEPLKQQGSDKCHNDSTIVNETSSARVGEGPSSPKSFSSPKSSSSSSPSRGVGSDGNTGLGAGEVQSNGSKEVRVQEACESEQPCLNDGMKEGGTATISTLSCGTPAPTDAQEGGSKRSGHGCDTRCVLITGYPTQIYQAELHIFQKVAEGTHIPFESCVLTCEAIVPTQIVGRIIGRMGQNVRELQNLTHAYVKVPDQPSRDAGEAPPPETAVKVSGNFYSVQAVQAHFAKLASELESHHPSRTAHQSASSRETRGADYVSNEQ